MASAASASEWCNASVQSGIHTSPRGPAEALFGRGYANPRANYQTRSTSVIDWTPEEVLHITMTNQRWRFQGASNSSFQRSFWTNSSKRPDSMQSGLYKPFARGSIEGQERSRQSVQCVNIQPADLFIQCGAKLACRMYVR